MPPCMRNSTRYTTPYYRPFGGTLFPTSNTNTTYYASKPLHNISLTRREALFETMNFT